MKANPSLGFQAHGWTVFAHPIFLAQVEALVLQVEALKRKDPDQYWKKNASKRLKAIYKLATSDIPQDPTRSDFRQGESLGKAHKHWFRAKFYQQYRLFFRYHEASKIVVLAWVNDEDTKRAYESADDAYRVFQGMLEQGQPPDGWTELLAEAMKAAPQWAKLASHLD